MANKKNRKKENFRGVSRSLAGTIGAILAKIFLGFKQAINNLPEKVKRYLLSAFTFILAIILFLSFFNLSGEGGQTLKGWCFYLFGEIAYSIPFVFVIFGFIFLLVNKRLFFTAFLGIFCFLIGASGLLEILEIPYFSGGKIGSLESAPLVNLFGELVSFFIFLAAFLVGLLSLINVFGQPQTEEQEKRGLIQSVKQVLDASKFKVLKVEPEKNINKKRVEIEVSEGAVFKAPGLEKRLPPLEFLDEEKEKSEPGDVKRNNAIIKKTLEDFNIDVSMAEVNVGPTVTQYTLKPPEGVKLSKITALSNNLSLALSAHPIRIEAPIPGRPLVGIEIPNSTRSKVRLRNLLANPDFNKNYSNLGFALGRDVAGNCVYLDLSRLPHLLVAGATGTGKTVFLNSLILSLFYKNTPETLRLILIDPKRVEFSIFKNLPHLLCPVVCDPQQSVNALSWLIEEMERRFKKLAEYNTRDIHSFNEKASKNHENHLYHIVLVIDELADLMVARGKEIETKIVRIAQMARAVGIHLVLATQRPSTEVITGLIKTNITCRISFQLPTQIDSRTVLDTGGAEKLLGAGDMLYISAETVKPRRVQGAYISEDEVKRVSDWIEEEIGPRSLLEDNLTKGLKEFLEETVPEIEGMGDMKADPLYSRAKEIVVRTQKASCSLLQRRLQIGYVRAARLLDMLEMDGVIAPGDGAKARKVYFKSEDEDDLEEELYE